MSQAALSIRDSYIRPRKPPCRHCGQRRSFAGRGLCAICWRNRVVRDCYPPLKGFHLDGVSADNSLKRPMPRPTEAPPGSPEKLAVLCKRAAAEQQLFHPEDRTHEDDE